MNLVLRQFGLSLHPWFTNFNPISMSNLATLVWVRFPNFPIHMTHPNILEDLENLLSYYIEIDLERILKGIYTFIRICVEMDLIKG